MKKNIFLILLLVLSFSFFNISFAKSLRVKGYFKKSGTYVNFYYKTSPNKTKLDNYSIKGNYNIYTGKKGTINPYKFKY